MATITIGYDMPISGEYLESIAILPLVDILVEFVCVSVWQIIMLNNLQGDLFNWPPAPRLPPPPQKNRVP